MTDRAQLTTPPIVRALPFSLISIAILGLVVEQAATEGLVPAVVGGVAGVVGGIAVIAVLVWVASHVVTVVKWPDADEDDRGQVPSDPFPIVTLSIGLGVAALVLGEVFATWRDRLAQCAPDCQLGAPLFANVGLVEAAVVVAVLLAAAVVPVLVRRRWGERDG